MDFIVCSLRNLKISEYKTPIKIKLKEKHPFTISYQEGVLIPIINSVGYRQNFGLLECDRLRTNFISLAISQINIMNKEQRIITVNNHYIYNQMFSNALWFIKDNAVTPYFTTISSDYQIEPESLRRNVYYTDSMGSFEHTDFTEKEIKEAEEWFGKLENYAIKVHKTKADITSNVLTNTGAYVPTDTSSFQRALLYLDTARKMDFLPSKIATYMTILESLFSVKGENTHKVAERTALLIGKDDVERMKLYKEVVSAYDIRSKYVHGSEISNSKSENLPITSQSLDSIVRRVLIMMLTEYPELDYKNKKDKKNPSSKSAQDVDDWFSELVIKRGV